MKRIALVITLLLALGAATILPASAVNETPLLTATGKEVGCSAWLTSGDEGNQFMHLSCDKNWAAAKLIVNDLAVQSAYKYHPLYANLDYSNPRDCWMGDGLVWKVKDGVKRNGKWDARATLECGT